MSNKADYRQIGKSTVCSEITEDEAKILAEIMGVRQLKDGELLVSEGEAVQTLFILASGKLAVFSADINAGIRFGSRVMIAPTPDKILLLPSS